MGWNRLSVAAFLTIGAVLLGLLNLAGRLPINGPTEPQQLEAKFEKINGADAVSLGGSIGNAVDFNAMCVDGAPFYNDGQDLFETEALIELILAQADHPDLFFVVLGPSSLYHDNGLPVQGSVHRRRAVYAFLQGEGRWELIEADWRQALLAQAMPAMGDELGFPWRAILSGTIGQSHAHEPDLALDTVGIAPEDANSTGHLQARQWEEEIDATVFYHPEVFEETTQALLRTAKMIDQAGGQLIVVAPPNIAPLVSELRRSRHDLIVNYSAALTALREEGAIVLDHWGDAEYSTRYELFRDASHLNAIGADKLSRSVRNRLVHSEIVEENECSK